MNEYQVTTVEVIGMSYDVLIQETIDCLGGYSYNPTAFKLFWISTMGSLTIQQVRAKCLVGMLFSNYRDVLPRETGELVLIQLIAELIAVNGQSEYFDFEYEQLKDGLISTK
jgi:hypothetical protein